MRLVFGAVMLSAWSAVCAQPLPDRESSAIEESRRHFTVGDELYRAGRYEDALREFERGYALSPRPAFLLNLAQAHRKLKRYDEAIADCTRFLATEPPPEVASSVNQLLQQLRSERDAAALAPRVVERPPEIAPPPIVVAPPPPAPRSRRGLWIGIGVGVGVVVAGVAIGLAIGLAPRSDSYPAAQLGVSFR
ncbi:MAG TPA: tetratricopeptide repeat protein [Polyangia bacterium]|nr:tetratricopeptide repeat protein [Polyangia bacterium]